MPETILNSPEIQEAAKESILTYFKRATSSDNRYFKTLAEVGRDNNVPIKDIEDILTSTIKEAVSDGKNYDLEDLEIMKKEVNLSKACLETIGGMLYKQALGHDNERLAEQVKEKFGVSKEILKGSNLGGEEKEKANILLALEILNIDKVEKIIDSSVADPNPATLPEVVNAASKVWIKLIESGYWDRASKLVSLVPLSEELDSKHKRSLVEMGFLSEVHGGHTETAIKIYDQYRLDLSVRQISEQIPSVKKFIEILESKFPKLYQKYFSSVEYFIRALPALRNERLGIELENNPFLGKALENNEQYGFKLLNKFGTLDKLSKANIKELYDNKEKIVGDLPQIDPNSRDFRIAMQSRLETYRRNKEIVSSLSKMGVDAEAWLNFEDESYFELGKGTELVTEQIDEAIIRISESIDKYIVEHKEIVGEFEKELSAHRVPTVNVTELKSKLEDMKNSLGSAKSENDVEKISGIEKGIAGLESQINNPKIVSAWSRFIGDIGRLTALRKDIVESYTKLKDEEKKMTEAKSSGKGAREQRKEVQRIKSELEKQKNNIYKKTNKLTSQISDFRTELTDVLSQTVGADRATAITQEIGERIAEPLDHYTTDSGVLEEILGKKEEDKLDGNTLRISVWDRNPDTDLYLGNYTNCCIRIDSEHMGEESTIADYLTDLGIQVVNVYDEKKKIPIASAWCWIGSDDEDNTALIVDNIEANTEYSTKFKAQLEKELKEYISSYAKSIGGVKSVVQGKKNNDLVISGMKGDYYKVGGYNRASGYFLEAESEDE